MVLIAERLHWSVTDAGHWDLEEVASLSRVVQLDTDSIVGKVNLLDRNLDF